jgi:hypothetical protein
MRKITWLAFGIVTAIATVTSSQAAIMPNHSILASKNRELQAQVHTPTKRSIVPKATAPKKYRIKYPNYQEFKLQESTKDQVDCQRVVNSANEGRNSSSGGFSMSTSVSTIGNPISGKCN